MEQLFYGPCFFSSRPLFDPNHSTPEDGPETQQIDSNYSTPEAESEMKFNLYLRRIQFRFSKAFMELKSLGEEKYGMEYSTTAVKDHREPPSPPIGSKKFKTQQVDTKYSTSKAEGEMNFTAAESSSTAAVEPAKVPLTTPNWILKTQTQFTNIFLSLLIYSYL
ncbi:hypothetical protein ACOSQ2_022291 [Xanthoceras sorbifolium]